MPRYKRDAATAELDTSVLEESAQMEPALVDMLTRLRNMWEFASLMQYIYLFGSVVKIDEDFDIEDLEQECVQSTSSDVLAGIGLALLKYVSSHRGLTLENFAEYTRRQYMSRLPAENCFGDDLQPIPFNDLDIYTRIRVLQQLSTWTFNNPDRIRSLMPENEDQLNWRMEPLGWDTDDRAYFVLDDNRLYRRTDEQIPPPTPPVRAKPKSAPKKKTRAATKPSRGTRASKRLRIEDSDDEDEEMVDQAEEVEESIVVQSKQSEHTYDYGFTSKTWECVAITLVEYQDFLSSIQRSRDPNEKQLRRRIEEEVLPVIEKRAEAIRQKQLKKLRELENLQKMATAKRSSRLADKADRQAKEEEERQVELKRQADLRMAREEQDRQKRIEEGHESRRLTREQRLKEREVKRILHEEELARLDREASAVASHQDTPELQADVDRKRLSSRNLQNQQEAHRKELERLTQDQEEDKWYFDCVVCGQHGENIDDGSHSVACEKCNVWQHSGCHGLTPEQCEDENFHFVCSSCKRKEQAAKEQARSGITLKLGKQNASSSPQATKAELHDNIAVKPVKKEAALPDFVQRQLDGLAQQRTVGVPQHPQHPLQYQHQFPPIHQYNAPQAAQHIPPYPAQGYGVAPPQQTSPYHASANGRVPAQAMAQHDWVHHNAVNQTVHQHYRPPQTQVNGSAQTYQSSFHVSPQQHAQYTNTHLLGQSLPGAQAVPTANRSQHSATTNGTTYAAQQGSTTQRAPHLSPAQAVARPSQQSPLVNGHQAPTPRTSFSYAQQTLVTPQRDTLPIQPAVGAQSGLPASPQPMPPPSVEYNRQAAISPIKSSPPRPAAASPLPDAQKLNAPGSFSNVSASPNASFEHAPKLATPSKATDVTVSPANGRSEVATNGMAGPWPDQSLSVPRKNPSPPPAPTTSQ